MCRKNGQKAVSFELKDESKGANVLFDRHAAA